MISCSLKILVHTIHWVLLLNATQTSLSQDQFFPLNDLLGRWAVIKVIEGDVDITSSMDQTANRRIEFFNDGFFESDGFPFGRYAGTYSLDEMTGTLTQVVDESTDASILWKVRHNGEHLIFQGTGKFSSYRFVLKKID